MRTERDIENEVCKWLKEQGHLVVRLRPESVRGFPDLTIVLKTGQTVYVEMKRPGGNASVHQLRWLEKLRSQGCHVRICRSLAEVQSFIRDLSLVYS
jgi:Holliday junction resolvase-like predicted endonuclease